MPSPSTGRVLAAAVLIALCAALPAGIAHAQSLQAQQQERANQVREQLRAEQLRAQQRQQTSDTLRKAFKSDQARQGIDQADHARRARERALQRARVEAYLHQENAASTARSSDTVHPAPASSSH